MVSISHERSSSDTCMLQNCWSNNLRVQLINNLLQILSPYTQKAFGNDLAEFGLYMSVTCKESKIEILCRKTVKTCTTTLSCNDV